MELSRFRFLFVPGFHYRTDPSSGADFAGPRTYLRNCGFDTQLVEVEEDGTIEQNASFIAEAVRKESSEGKRLIVVSTSIGGPETAVALGKLLPVDDLRPVAAWISVGGLWAGPFWLIWRNNGQCPGWRSLLSSPRASIRGRYPALQRCRAGDG